MVIRNKRLGLQYLCDQFMITCQSKQTPVKNGKKIDGMLGS